MDPLDPYFLALGKFVHRYAIIEKNLSHVLALTARVGPNTAKAIFSGTRINAAISFIKRVHESEDQSLTEWLEKAFPKIGQLTSVRDEILHQGFSLSSDQILVTNRDRNIPRATYEKSYSVTDLHNLELDACVCIACLNVHWAQVTMQEPPGFSVQQEMNIARRSWSYT